MSVLFLRVTDVLWVLELPAPTLTNPYSPNLAFVRTEGLEDRETAVVKSENQTFFRHLEKNRLFGQSYTSFFALLLFSPNQLSKIRSSKLLLPSLAGSFQPFQTHDPESGEASDC